MIKRSYEKKSIVPKVFMTAACKLSPVLLLVDIKTQRCCYNTPLGHYTAAMIRSVSAQQYPVIICRSAQKVICDNSATLTAPKEQHSKRKSCTFPQKLQLRFCLEVSADVLSLAWDVGVQNVYFMATVIALHMIALHIALTHMQH